MIRCIFWRLLFEICNIKRLFGGGSQSVQYLAFGANLSDAVLKQRRIIPLATKPFTLRNYGLRFDHPSRWVDCGYASAEQAPGESLHGFLYTLSVRDAARMDFYECASVLNRYRRTFVDQDGESLYFYQTNLSTPDLNPSTEYLGYITEGLKLHPGASTEYRNAIAATPTVEQGSLVRSYLWKQPENRSPWLRRASESYQLFVQTVFLMLLYDHSLTVHFIRR